MSKTKAHPERVIPGLALLAMAKCKPGQRAAIYSDYIIMHYRSTGKLAPGCDARDLYAWLEQNTPEELAAVTMKGKK